MPHTSRIPFAARLHSSMFPLIAGALFTGTLCAQTTDVQSQPAPIERSQPAQQMSQPTTLTRYTSYTTSLAAGQVLSPTTGVASAQPAAGIYIRVAPNSSVRAVSIDANRAEFKVERGLVNLSVHGPAKNQLILVDLPGGQVQALKDGFYTFNAATDTVRVLRGEADAFVGAASGEKPVKVKEGHAVTFPQSGTMVAKVRSVEFYPYEGRSDVIPDPGAYARATDGPRYAYPGYYGYGFYGDYYPYYAWGYPYYGYPFGFGVGFGYGFYGRGFYGGGFHGRR